MDNTRIEVIGLLMNVKQMLKADRRDQVSAIELDAINGGINMALMKLNTVGIKDVRIIGNLIAVSQCITTLLADKTFVQTDTVTKELMAEKIDAVIPTLCLETGKYYMTHEFEYYIKMDKILALIIEECLRQEFYFGMEVRV